MCPEHIKTHIHLNLTRLPDYASVRSEIETFLEARQSSSNPDAMDIGSLNGQQGVCRNCGQKGHSAASCPKRGKSGGNGDDGKGQGKKGKSSKGKTDDGKGKGKGGKWQAHKALVSASKVCRKGYQIILDSKPGQSGMLHKRANEWIGLREEKRCPRFRWLGFSGSDSWEEKIGICQFDTV